MAKPNKILWMELTVSGTKIPVYCTKLQEDLGTFTATTLEICIDYRQAATTACVTLGHEWKHARMFLDDHTDFAGPDAEAACDRFAREALEFFGGAPMHWLASWDRVRAEWKRANKARKT